MKFLENAFKSEVEPLGMQMGATTGAVTKAKIKISSGDSSAIEKLWYWAETEIGSMVDRELIRVEIERKNSYFFATLYFTEFLHDDKRP